MQNPTRRFRHDRRLHERPAARPVGWNSGHISKSSALRELDSQTGRPNMVEYRVSAMGRSLTNLLQAGHIVMDSTSDRTFRIEMPSTQISMPHTPNLQVSPDLQAPYHWRKPYPDRMLLPSEIPNARSSSSPLFSLAATCQDAAP